MRPTDGAAPAWATPDPVHVGYALLVGRQWSRPVSAAASADSGARKTVPPGKRGCLSAAGVEPSPSVDQKLTFYQTLTAPLGRGSADASQHPEAKAQPAPEPVRAEPPPPPYPYTSRGETLVEKPAAPEAEAAPVRAQADAAGFWSGLWSVQVAAFKTQGQAASLHKQLKEAGFDAYIAPAVASDVTAGGGVSHLLPGECPRRK